MPRERIWNDPGEEAPILDRLWYHTGRLYSLQLEPAAESFAWQEMLVDEIARIIFIYDPLYMLPSPAKKPADAFGHAAMWKLVVRFMYVVVYLLIHKETDWDEPAGTLRDDLRRLLKTL